MLRFPSPPDILFRKFFKRALNAVIDEMELFTEFDKTEEEKQDSCFFFLQKVIAKYGTTDNLRNLIIKMLEAYKARGLYHLTDYHWEILYYILDYYRDIYNDLVPEIEPRHYGNPKYDWAITINGKRITRLDTHFENYFWDYDFMIEPEVVTALGGSEHPCCGFTPELMGVVNGMAPHPNEIAFKKVEHPDIIKNWVKEFKERNGSWRMGTNLCDECKFNDNDKYEGDCEICKGPVK